ncbi:MAG TPA: MBL fold metallo-hydrolase [Methanothrix sp.]|nr:MBL fold metallo-hydrolase [Methanothrix sp.]
MLFERIVSSGLAHYSYLVGDRNDAVVIDPRRDCEVYIKKASSEGMRIAHILETHRNEDYFVGSVELARRTGAEAWHADSQLDYRYGKAVQPGQRWNVGRLVIEAIPTPGHTPGSMSYLLRDPAGAAWVVFTGDALFAGEVGRIVLLGLEKAPEMAGLLYDSIFQRLLPLGDEVLVCPAHGSGSVCGESIAERLWTTIGLEKRHNPRLKLRSREEFSADLLKSKQERPPYFRMMEKVNLNCQPALGALPRPKPLAPDDFESLSKEAQILDTRMELGFGAAHIPGSQFIWLNGLASFAGWFLAYDRPIILVTEANEPCEPFRILIRLGFDNVAGYLAGGMLNWHMSGRMSNAIQTITVQDLCSLLDREEALWILDVRSERELESDGRITGAQHIHVTQIPEQKDEVPKDRRIYIFCGSGLRSMIAASYLERHGWRNLAVILGGIAGWRSKRCPIKK